MITDSRPIRGTADRGTADNEFFFKNFLVADPPLECPSGAAAFIVPDG
jgi:hypothetical protein